MERVTVDTADSLDLIASMEYDAIVTDARCRGQTVSRCWVRSGRSGLARPPLVITGHGDHALAIDALRGGAYDFIQKPIDREYFVTSLRRVIQIAELRRRVKEQKLALGATRTNSKEVVRLDVRIIAASVSLAREVKVGRFRQDVYYRLNGFVITLPPLRERDDMLDLANGFLVEANMSSGEFITLASQGKRSRYQRESTVGGG